MGTKNLYKNEPNPFFLFGTKNMVRVELIMATVLFRDGFDRSGCVLIFLQTTSLMRWRYNNEIAE